MPENTRLRTADASTGTAVGAAAGALRAVVIVGECSGRGGADGSRVPADWPEWGIENGPDGPAGRATRTMVEPPAVAEDQVVEGTSMLRSTGPSAAVVDAARAVRAAGPAALIRDVILGGQDGLVNVLGLVLGLAVATSDARLVVTAGLAALLAESIAMAGVAFTASGAERQLHQTNRRLLEELREFRTHHRRLTRRRRLTEIGWPSEVVDIVSEETAAEAAVWADEVERLRIDLAPVRETLPIRAAVVVGLSTAAGSSVPLLPFVLLPLSIAPFVALTAGGFVLAIAGVERARITGGSQARAAVEMLAIGLVSAFAGYLIGQILRVPGA
jgi:VIT1/CCC1 family predicted Fe2+/Mn2+ transporter